MECLALNKDDAIATARDEGWTGDFEGEAHCPTCSAGKPLPVVLGELRADQASAQASAPQPSSNELAPKPAIDPPPPSRANDGMADFVHRGADELFDSAQARDTEEQAKVDAAQKRREERQRKLKQEQMRRTLESMGKVDQMLADFDGTFGGNNTWEGE